MSSEFDIIFAGGGTAACVVAGRLIAADPSLKILIVERGQHSRDLPIHFQPCRYLDNLAPASTTTSTYAAKPTKELNECPSAVNVGKCVGGGSAVNFMVYVRGAASDYDDWAEFGNEGWRFEELLPLIKKIETFNPMADQPTHGYDGPIQISPPQPDLAAIGRQFLDVGKEYEPHRPVVDDCNDFKTANAYGPFYKYVNPHTGRRSDAASAYLYPHSQNPNLEIRVGMCVKRVIIKDGRAVGVEYTAETSSPEGATNIVVATASKLVVVSAGAMGSPAILERSGIGNSSILNSINVHVQVDLPGVGENYQDHFGSFPPFHAADDAVTLDDVWSDPEEVSARSAEWLDSGKGKVACNGLDALMKFRPTPSELASLGPAFQPKWESFFQHKTDKPVAIITEINGYTGYATRPPPSGRSFVTMCYFLLYPGSIGSVHITSGENAHAPLDFDPRFLTDAGDIACLTMLYKKMREICRRMPAYRGEVTSRHPSFAADSPAACRVADGPAPIVAPDIVYSAEDDKAIEDYHRKFLQATWHSIGTCAMKPREKGGVVDSRLNVYGVKGLKVADLSICPSNVGNNTYSTALLVGEKAAALVAEDLGINLV